MISSVDGALVVPTLAFDTLACAGDVGVVRKRRATTGAETFDRAAPPTGAIARRSETDRRAGFILAVFERYLKESRARDGLHKSVGATVDLVKRVRQTPKCFELQYKNARLKSKARELID